MKLDKIKFARLISYLSRHNELGSGEIEAIDNLIDIELPEVEAPVVRPSNGDVDRLMMLMAEGTRKIEAIKIHRSITGLGLKESKDAVERYWVSKPEPEPIKGNLWYDSKDATLGDILHSAGYIKGGNNIG